MSVYETSITNPKKQLEFYKDLSKQLEKENQELKKQLDYLRSDEYLNQLRFERDMLQHVVDNNEVYEKTQSWGRIDFVKRIVQMQQDIDDLTSCINVYRKDIDKAIKILGGKR